MKTMSFLQKKSILFICFSLLISCVYAGPVGKQKAQMVAQNFLSRELKIDPSKTPTDYEAIMDETNKSQCVMHVFKGNNSYIVISADDRVYPVLAYSNEGTFPGKGIVPAFDWWMDNLAKEIATESRLKSSVRNDISKAWDSFSSNQKTTSSFKSTNAVAPLLSTTWNQNAGYNHYCPVSSTGPGGKCYAGCVSTAMSQVMRFYNYPQQGRGYYEYIHPAFGLQSADFGNTTYDWSNMPNDISTTYIIDTITRNAVAKLMYHCGVSIDMDYLPSGSGAQTFNVPYALYTYFKYRRYVDFVQKANFTDDVWRNMLIENLDMGYPIVYNGRPTTGDGHAWVCDGYDLPTHFHFNFGWGGNHNDYFYLNSINSGNGIYTFYQGAVINIVPDLPTYPLCIANKTYTAQNYIFTDGSYTDNYLNNTNCQWLIQPDTLGTDTLRLSFTEFRTELNKDFLTVYDGTTTSAPVLGTYSGNHTSNLPATLTSTSGAFLLVFATDGTNTDLGWTVKYTTKAKVIVGIQENDVVKQLSVYPNPANGKLNISGNFNVSGTVKYNVTNIIGATVFSSELNISEGLQNKTIDISQLKAGIYILNIESEKGKAYTKFVVE